MTGGTRNLIYIYLFPAWSWCALDHRFRKGEQGAQATQRKAGRGEGEVPQGRGRARSYRPHQDEEAIHMGELDLRRTSLGWSEEAVEQHLWLRQAWYSDWYVGLAIHAV